MSTSLTGGCACGKVRFSANGAPKFAFICQCRSCQHLSGSGHAVQFCHDADAFAVIGETACWERTTDGGSTVAKIFCPTCGTPIYGTTTRADSIVMVLAGALDDPSKITPDRIFFADEAQPWDHASVASQNA